jgi:hypothetical protein
MVNSMPRRLIDAALGTRARRAAGSETSVIPYTYTIG